MKQVLSVADLAMLLNLVNDRIQSLESAARLRDVPILRPSRKSEEEIKERCRESIEELHNSAYYKSLMHLKTALENLNVEIETPELEIEPNFYDAKTFEDNKEKKK